jgi:WD40 repeat protein
MSNTTIFSSTLLDGHRNSVNAVKFDADLSMLLSGGKLLVSPPFRRLNTLPDNSGLIIVWDLGSNEPLQTIDASFAGSATALCWINVLKDGTADKNTSPAFAVGFGTGIIAIYRQSLDNVRKFLPCLNAMLTTFSFAAPF